MTFKVVPLTDDAIVDVPEITSSAKLSKTLMSLSPDAWDIAQLKTRGVSLRNIYIQYGGAYTYDEINYMLKQVVACNAALAIKNPEMLRQLLIDKLDDVEERLNVTATQSGGLDQKIAMALIRTVETKAKLLGLNAPEKVDVSVTHTIQTANETLKEKLENMRKHRVIDVTPDKVDTV